jgi:mono/diheme cytochrome c family protein
MKNSPKTRVLKQFVLAGCAAVFALCAGQALAYNSLVEEHIAATYGYGLLKVPAAGRSVMLAAADPSDADADKGKSTFDAKCALCHSIGNGDKIGPDLKGVTHRHPDKWLTWWLLETDRMQKTDPEAMALLAKYKTPMPNLGLKPNEVRELLEFLHKSDHNGIAKN